MTRGVAEDAMAVAAGLAHSAAFDEDGVLFVWGWGERGQLGTGNTDSRLTLTRVHGLPAPVAQIAAGQSHTAIVTETGDLFMFGAGKSGQLGLFFKFDSTFPTLLDRALFHGDAVLVVACGIVHTAVLTECGGVYTFGAGWLGQLGHGNKEDQHEPRRVPATSFNDERVVMLAAGFSHTVALSEEGRVYTWGRGGSGQLGHNYWGNETAPRLVDPGRFGDKKVVFVSAGGYHTLALTSREQLFTWGEGFSYQLGHGNNCNKLVPTLVGAEAFGGSTALTAACGRSHTLVVTRDGALWACGNGAFGQLGLGHMDSRQNLRQSFVRVGASEFCGVRIAAVYAGHLHSMAVTEDGALWTWGQGDDGRLGNGDEERRWSPHRVSAAGFGSVGIGRHRELPAEHTIAFAMGSHRRLGGSSDAHCSRLKEELVGMIVDLCDGWLANRRGKSEGVARLLGGGLMRGTQ